MSNKMNIKDSLSHAAEFNETRKPLNQKEKH